MGGVLWLNWGVVYRIGGVDYGHLGVLGGVTGWVSDGGRMEILGYGVRCRLGWKAWYDVC